ncbi:hypothetical protein [Janthinobacterium psychrotolerans]|uniref:Uncharacterized protein n=1 Tax=Janthinobacterium psychrotolerans TaxID=1747903 RepID=A0A1A7BX38_9BURK|nr:hypothetical protein [Janthinobacterium psychrotolerans]OBV38082.1 hypothetical protein ASR47_100535 [Janthinobacterium psychrotolerans]
MAWYDKWAVMVIAAAIGMAGYNGIPWCKMGVAEWAYWVGAIGTVCTLIGTIWLATVESRRRRKEQLSLAIVMAIEWSFRLRFIQATLKSIMNTLDVEPGDFNLPDYNQCAKALESIGSWTSADVAPLVVAERDIATNLMVASSNLLGSIPMIRVLDEAVTRGVILHTSDADKAVTNRLAFAHEGLSDAARELVKFLLEHGAITEN